MPKLKTKIVRFVVTHFDKYKEWDKRREYPEIDPVWEERIAPDAWHAYNDTYGGDIGSPAKGSYAEYCNEKRGGYPGYLRLITGELLETPDSTIDRMASSANVKGQNWMEIGRRMYEIYDSVTEPGQVASAEFADPDNPKRVAKFMVVGSADFFDLDDETKVFMSEKWYRMWYDENEKRGLVDFPYSFPTRFSGSNREIYGSVDSFRAVKAYEKRSDRKMSFAEWLDSDAEAVGEIP